MLDRWPDVGRNREQHLFQHPSQWHMGMRSGTYTKLLVCCRSRASRRQREEDDVEISDEEEEMAAMAWSPGRNHQVAVVLTAPLFEHVMYYWVP